MSRGWRFERRAPDEGRDSNTSSKNFDSDIGTFVRETLQNSNDAGPIREDEPVQVRYRIRLLQGRELKELKRAIDWSLNPARDANSSGLQKHLQAIADTGDNLRLKRLLENEVEDKLVVASVEDRNTRGLQGSEEAGDHPYSALVLDDGKSAKDTPAAGGSHGVGKSVLRLWSGLSTLLFHSNPHDMEKEPPRLVGSIRSADHEVPRDEYDYTGVGVFGDLEPDQSGGDQMSGYNEFSWGGETGRPHSLWGERAQSVAEQLPVGEFDSTGTDIVLLGFSEPGESKQYAPEDAAEQIANSVSKWFWPAILRGSLEVTVDSPERTLEVDPGHSEEVVPFVQCIEKRDETVDALEQPGDIAVTHPTFDIEDKRPDAVPEDESPATESGEVALYVRSMEPNDNEGLVNQIAFVRGPGMVVKYYRPNRTASGGRQFHGVVLTGEARPWQGPPTEADADIDEFLAAAEPPEHDEWTGEDRLKEQYQRGCVNTIKGFTKDIVRDNLEKILRERPGSGSVLQGIEFDLPTDPKETHTPSTNSDPVITKEAEQLEYLNTSNRWKFEIRLSVEVEDYVASQTRLHMVEKTEDGKTYQNLQITDVTVETGRSDDELQHTEINEDGALVRVDSEVGDYRVEGRTEQVAERVETEIDVDWKILRE